MTDAAAIQRPLITSALMLAAWVAAALWLTWRLATAWPYSGSYAQIGLAFAGPGVLYRAFSLGYIWRSKRPLRGWRHWLARLLALPLGLLAPIPIWDSLAARSMAGLEHAMGGLVQQVRSQLPNPCPPTARYVAGPDLTDYLARVPGVPFAPGAIKGSLYHDGTRFVLSFMGGSIDFDGSTIFYDSADGVWEIFHNDVTPSVQAFEVRTKGMQTCKIVLP